MTAVFASVTFAAAVGTCACAVRNARRHATRARLVKVAEEPAARNPDRATIAVAILGAAVGWQLAAAAGLVVVPIGAVVALRTWRRRSVTVPIDVVRERFADAVGALAAAVRAGSSLPQAIRYAADEAAPPVRDRLEQVVGALDTGAPLESALTAWARHEQSSEVDLLVGALDLHRTSGGDLPAVLTQVAGSIRERVSIAREVRSLTAQARLSAWILGLLPVGFFAFLWLTARNDIQGAVTTPLGIGCLIAGGVLEVGAFLWIRTLLVVA